jgi:hypothetical protein
MQFRVIFFQKKMLKVSLRQLLNQKTDKYAHAEAKK